MHNPAHPDADLSKQPDASALKAPGAQRLVPYVAAARRLVTHRSSADQRDQDSSDCDEGRNGEQAGVQMWHRVVEALAITGDLGWNHAKATPRRSMPIHQAESHRDHNTITL